MKNYVESFSYKKKTRFETDKTKKKKRFDVDNDEIDVHSILKPVLEGQKKRMS